MLMIHNQTITLFSKKISSHSITEDELTIKY